MKVERKQAKWMGNRETKYWNVHKNVDNLKDTPQIMEAGARLRQNEVVAFPTETVYGLGANALSDRAVEKIFAAKGRPADNPLIIHIAKEKQLQSLVKNVSEKVRKLMEAFWPGPLTVIFPAAEDVGMTVTAGLATVAVRMPDHPVAQAVIEAAGFPLAAPSANRSGKPSPTTAAHVYNDLQGRIAGIVDGGETGIGVESTVVDGSGEKITILRPGDVTKTELERVLNEDVASSPADTGETPKSPGMKYRHYAPSAALYLVDGSLAFLQNHVDLRRKAGLKVGVLTTAECQQDYRADIVLSCGVRTNLATVAHGLYSTLRTFDGYDVDEIYSEVFPEQGVGAAIMNRLKKSAGGRLIKENRNA